ncbi:Hypothetical_protein [Hexamita inflata]|uniref:Hypothetical_protein n=1 Tax=Hexamita inflata TaxID=28002 RepID=A0AA86UWA5_9EUKA|nr:Hypothetical protein HINF_LOCUS62070 [Hexamita inflata]
MEAKGYQLTVFTFLGQTFSQSSTSSLAERLTDKIDKCLKVLEASPITNHQKLAGKCGIFKALRAEYLNTLQDHPGVPAIGYAINNFTYLTDNIIGFTQMNVVNF